MTEMGTHHWPAETGAAKAEPALHERPLWWLLLLIVSFVVFVPSLRGGFIWDDDRYVSANRNLENIDGLIRIWTAIGPEAGGTQQYYPLTHTTFWVENQLWGKTPIGYRIVNLILHGVSAILIWEILRRLAVPGAFVVSLVFAVHPIQVESVAWISERKNTLSLMLMLAFAFVYLVYAGVIRSSLGLKFASLLDDQTAGGQPQGNGAADIGRGQKWTLALAAMLFMLALLSKTVACVAPAMLLMVLWWKRRLSPSTGMPLLLLLVPGLAAAALTGFIERKYVGAVGSDFDLGVVDRLSVAGSVTWFYVKQMLMPIQMSFLYTRWDPQPWMSLGLALAMAVAVVLFVMQRRIGRGPVVGWLIFLAGIAPAMGFANVFPMRYSWAADHFAYVGSVGLIGLVVAAVASAVPVAKTRTAGMLAGIVVTALGAHSWIHSHNFVSSADLFLDTLVKTPTAWMAHHNYGLEQVRLGTEALRLAEAYEAEAKRLPGGALRDRTLEGASEARQEFRAKYDRAKEAALKTIELRPSHAGAYHTLAIISLSEGDRPGAVAKLRKSTELWRTARDRYPQTYELLGKMLEEDGDTEGAIEALRGAIGAENPPYTQRSTGSRITLAKILMRQKQLQEAERYLVDAVQINLQAERRAIAEGRQSPPLAEPLVLLADVQERQGKITDALNSIVQGARLDQANVSIQISVAVLYGKAGNLKLAGDILEDVVRANPANEEAKQLLERLRIALSHAAARQRATTAPTTVPGR